MSEKSLKHTHKKPGTPLGRLNHECLDYVIYTFDIHKVERVEKMHKTKQVSQFNMRKCWAGSGTYLNFIKYKMK